MIKLDKNDSPNYFRTPDLALTAALLAKNHKLEKIKRENNRCYFYLIKDENIERDSLAFFNRSLKVSAFKMAEEMRSLKRMLFTT